MNSANQKFLVLLLAACVLSGCASFSRMLNRGGTAFTVEIQTDEPNRADVLERAVKVTQNKIDAIGLAGEVAKLSENRISVKLYGKNDLERIRKFLFTTHRLELKKIVGDYMLQSFPTQKEAEKSATGKQEVLPFQEMGDSSPEKFLVVEKQTVISGDDIRDAHAWEPLEDGNYQINFTLKTEAAQKFGDWTGKNIGQQLAIVLDKKVISAATIQGQIFDQGQITGRFTKESAEEIALSLRSGYLPATMKVVEEKTF